MKVTGGKGPRPTQGVGATKAPTSPARAAAPSDVVSIFGVPEAELTPRVRAALTGLMQEVATLRAEIAAMQARMGQLALEAERDPLVDALNRRAFVRELNRTLAMVARYRQPAALLFLDLDRMKSLNDRHGHAAGDAALRHVAGLIAANIRQTDILGRLGGDEFAVILNFADADVARTKARSLADIVASTPFVHDGEPISVSLSAGAVPIAHEASTDAEAVLREADAAMYSDKRRS